MKRYAARFAAGLAVLVAAAGAVVVCLVPPTGGGPFPPCLFNLSTGLYCPGCGGTRALHLLLNGDFVGALYQNALILLALPLGTWYAGAATVFTLTGKWRAPSIMGRRLTIVIAAVVVGFAVARNLPILSSLAPTPLPEAKRELSEPAPGSR